MKHRFLFILALLFTACGSLFTESAAQTTGGTVPIKWVSALPSNCVPSRKDRVLVYKYTATTGVYFCSAANTWTQLDQTATSALTLTQGTITANTPFINHAATWNAGGVTFTGFKSNTTDTASSAASLLADFQIGGTSRFNIGKTGAHNIVQGTLTTTATPWLNHTATWNDAGTTHQGILSNITNTNSAAASTLIDLQVGGASQFKVTRAGVGTFAGGVTLTDLTTTGNVELGHASDTTLSRTGAGAIAVEGVAIPTISSTSTLTNKTLGATTITGKLTSTQGTLTADTPYIDHTATWNNGAMTFNGILSNVTNTASGATSKLIDLQVGGVSQFNVDKSGTGTFASGVSATSGAFTLPITSTQGTITASAPFINHTATWNNAGVTFTNISSNITDAASGVNSLLLNLQIGGVTKFSVGKRRIEGYVSDSVFLGGDSGNNTLLEVNNVSDYVAFTGGANLAFNASGVNNWQYRRTITAAGTTGAQTINRPAGTVNFAAGASAITVTNSIVTTSSIIFATMRTNDATCAVKSVVPGAGSFVINMTANCTAETSVGFLVTN